MFIGPCIIAIVDDWKTNLMSLVILFYLLCAQHVSDINISIIRSFDCVVELPHRSSCSQFAACWRFGAAVFEWCSCCRLQPATRALLTDVSGKQLHEPSDMSLLYTTILNETAVLTPNFTLHLPSTLRSAVEFREWDGRSM